MGQVTAKDNKWRSNLGFIISTIGAAVGLGQLWKFPYECGANGGTVFLCLFVLFTFLVGIPLFLIESSIGLFAGRETISAIKMLANRAGLSIRWRFLGVLGNITMVMIMSFYAVISGWCLLYIYYSVTNSLDAQMSVIEQLLAFYLFIMINVVTVIKGSRGIEKLSKVGMFLLLFMLLSIVIYNYYNFNMSHAVRFLFTPDLSKLNVQTVFSAMGQACFSLAVGAGCICVYSSYSHNNGKLLFNSHAVSMSNVLIAIVAGLVIFPVTFAYDIPPDSGITLIFETLPRLFHNLPYGGVLSCVLFSLFTIAALTSSVSLMEAPVAGMIANSKLSRVQVIIFLSLILTAIGTLYIIDESNNIMPLVITLATDLLIPIGGLLFSIFFLKVRHIVTVPGKFYNLVILFLPIFMSFILGMQVLHIILYVLKV